MEALQQFNQILLQLPANIKNMLSALAEDYIIKIREIRLAAGAPIVVVLEDKPMFLSEKGLLFLPSKNSYILTPYDLQACFAGLCQNSVHTHAQEIRSGFIILPKGSRAGVAGTGVYANGILSTFREISSINLRIAKAVNEIAVPFLSILQQGNALIVGPPASGKTTFLRDAVRVLSNSGQRVALIDSRGEIAACLNGVPQFDVGYCTDVLSRLRKEDGIDIAVRCLNPKFVVFDELSSIEEAQRVQHCFFAGVKVICSLHAGSLQELYSRDFSRFLINSGCISNILFLPGVGKKTIVYKTELKPQNKKTEMQHA